MTKEEKLSILGAKLVEVYEAIRDSNAKDEAMPRLIHLAEEIEWRMNVLERPEMEEPFVSPAPTPAPVVETPKPAEPAPAPKTEQPETGAKPGMTKAEMVSKLTTFQTNGVAIDKVMESMGYTKLSQVPANQYEKLLELCQKALDGED